MHTFKKITSSIFEELEINIKPSHPLTMIPNLLSRSISKIEYHF